MSYPNMAHVMIPPALWLRRRWVMTGVFPAPPDQEERVLWRMEHVPHISSFWQGAAIVRYDPSGWIELEVTL